MSRKAGTALIAAFASGLLFAVGLGVAGMTQPSKVIGFLDLFGGSWDPSLGLVMAAAIAVHAPLARWIRRRPDSLVERASCAAPGDEQTEAGLVGSTSATLLAGAAVFGVGWGLGGYCPGPAVVSLVSGASGVLVFGAAMVGGMLLFRILFTPAHAVEDRSPESMSGAGEVAARSVSP